MSDKSRQEFETAFKHWHPDKTGPYMKSVAEYFWNASRASIEFELPELTVIAEEDQGIPDLCDWDNGRNTGIDECLAVLRAAGLKVKG